MNKKILIVLGSVLILAIFLIGLVSADAADLVYYVGQEQSGKLTAQNPEAQQALNIYNVMSVGNYLGFAQSQICQQADAKSMCKMMSTFQTYSSYTDIIKNPSSYFQKMLDEEICKENPNACSTYSKIMQAKAQASNLGDTARAYATQMATEQMRGVVPGQVSTIISYKRYLDVFQMQPKEKAPKIGADPLEGIDDDDESQLFADEDIKVTNNQIKRGYEDSCRIGFNLDGTFGDVYNCETGIPKDRTGWKGYDLSKILGQDAGTLLVGAECHLERRGSGITITTDDTKGKAAICFITHKENSFTNLVGGEVEKGPNGKKIQSGIFNFSEDGDLTYAEFQVAKESEFIFVNRKYKLQKGTTVIIDKEDVKFGFDDVKDKDKKVELFSLKNGKWGSSGLVVPTSIAPVTIKALQNGRYLVTGNFEIKGNVEDIQIGPKSIASINGIEMRTTENQLRYTNCKTDISGDWLNFCKREKNNDLYASGNGFAFKENIYRGRYYYLRGGEVSVRLEEVKPNLYKRTAFAKGGIVAPETNLYLSQHNKLLQIEADKQIETGIIENPRDEVKKSGSGVWNSLGKEGLVPDTLNGGYLETEDNIVSSVTVFQDANVMSFAQVDGTCLVNLEEGNAITAAVIADITGHDIEEIQAQINAANEPSAECNQPGEVKIPTPTSTPNVIVELRSLKVWSLKKLNLYINGEEVTMFYFHNMKVGLKTGAKTYLADPWSKQLFESKVVEVTAKLEPVATLSSEVVKFIEEQMEDDERYIAANQQMTEGTAESASMELVADRIYVIKEGSGMTKDWSFTRTMQGAWGGCEKIREDSPTCPVDLFMKCIDESGREFLSSIEEGCPSGSQTYSRWLKLQRQQEE